MNTPIRKAPIVVKTFVFHLLVGCSCTVVAELGIGLGLELGLGIGLELELGFELEFVAGGSNNLLKSTDSPLLFNTSSTSSGVNFDFRNSIFFS